MMQIDHAKLNELCMDNPDCPSNKQNQEAFLRSEDHFQGSNASIGRILIISEDSMVRDFLGQMVRLFGYDSQVFCEWPLGNLWQSGQGVDAIFLEGNVWTRWQDLRREAAFPGQGAPMIVVVARESQVDQLLKQQVGVFRVLQKPLDYRQMGDIMEECFVRKCQIFPPRT